jgi:hypothetical protein
MPSAAAPARTRLVVPTADRVALGASMFACAAELVFNTSGYAASRGPTMAVIWSAAAVPVLLARRARILPAQSARAWAPTWLAAALVVLAVLATGGTTLVAAAELAGLSVVEEVVYRIALPYVLIAALRGAGLGTRPGIAVVFAAGYFVVLPGHLDQVAMGGPVVLVSLVCMAALTSAAVWATGAIVPAAAVHAAVNLTLLPVESGAWPMTHRTVAVPLLLAALVWGTHRQQVAAAAGTGMRATPVGRSACVARVRHRMSGECIPDARQDGATSDSEGSR